MKRIIWISLTLLVTASCILGAQAGGGRAQSPASQRPPQTVTPQVYPPEQVKTGQARFASQCAFCHGRDTAGGETGPDLTRSTLVAEDLRGDKIGPMVRAGRADKGMPSFDLNAADLGAIVAFIHDEKTKAEALGGGRRSVDVADLQTGNAEAGRLYFNGAGAAGVLTTASGITFSGDVPGNLLALRTSDGTTLWHAAIGRVGNSPITYRLDGRQYLIVGGGNALYAFVLQ